MTKAFLRTCVWVFNFWFFLNWHDPEDVIKAYNLLYIIFFPMLLCWIVNQLPGDELEINS